MVITGLETVCYEGQERCTELLDLSLIVYFLLYFDTKIIQASSCNIGFSNLFRGVGFEPCLVGGFVGGLVLICNVVVMLKIRRL